jgi:hypothetical protein
MEKITYIDWELQINCHENLPLEWTYYLYVFELLIGRTLTFYFYANLVFWSDHLFVAHAVSRQCYCPLLIKWNFNTMVIYGINSSTAFPSWLFHILWVGISMSWSFVQVTIYADILTLFFSSFLSIAHLRFQSLITYFLLHFYYVIKSTYFITKPWISSQSKPRQIFI